MRWVIEMLHASEPQPQTFRIGHSARARRHGRPADRLVAPIRAPHVRNGGNTCVINSQHSPDKGLARREAGPRSRLRSPKGRGRGKIGPIAARSTLTRRIFSSSILRPVRAGCVGFFFRQMNTQPMSEIDDLKSRLSVILAEAAQIRRSITRLKDRAGKRDAWARRQGFATRDEFEAARAARRVQNATDRETRRQNGRNAKLAHLTPEQKKARQRAQQRAWYDANRDKVRDYREKHRPARKAHERNRRHRIRANTPPDEAITPKQVEALRADAAKGAA